MVSKTKALISFAVTVKLICVFVFAYADCWFSHGAAHILAMTAFPIFKIVTNWPVCIMTVLPVML